MIVKSRLSLIASLAYFSMTGGSVADVFNGDLSNVSQKYISAPFAIQFVATLSTWKEPGGIHVHLHSIAGEFHGAPDSSYYLNGAYSLKSFGIRAMKKVGVKWELVEEFSTPINLEFSPQGIFYCDGCGDLVVPRYLLDYGYAFRMSISDASNGSFPFTTDLNLAAQ